MKAKNHPDYQMESKRLEETLEHMDRTIHATEDYRRLYKDNIKDAMSELDFLDSSQSYINILVNTKFIEMADRNFESLVRSIKKPYFARIDFREKGSQLIEKFYIGKTSLLKDGQITPVIVDWRAPVSNLYYESRLGETSYEAEGELQEGELFLKRQITVDDGQLLDILDVDITTNDGFLQASLEANADEKLKDIASTIQAEQNRIIRADMRKPLIVQGVAGSGKTTIALHRIAYFIYTYEKTFDPESFMILAPNRLFINYISEVLPELGVEKVKQTTFIDFMDELLGKRYSLIDTNQKLMHLIHKGQDAFSAEEMAFTLWSTEFKGSIAYKNILEAYLKDIEKHFTPSEHFIFDGKTLLTRVEIRNLFLYNYQDLPYYKRIHEIKKSLINKLKLYYKDTLENTAIEYDAIIAHILQAMESSDNRRTKVVSLMDERDARINTLKRTYKTAIKHYLALFPSFDLMHYYTRLVCDFGKMKKYAGDSISESNLKYFCQLSQKLYQKNRIELEDYAGLVYLKKHIFGFLNPVEINSLVIDEAQDFSIFQFFILKHVLKTDRFTILGDTSQGIHSYRGIDNWNDVMTQIFEDSKPNYMTLVQSYRTTIEIMDMANSVLKKLNNEQTILAKPVIRRGAVPGVHSFDCESELINALEEQMYQMHGLNYKSIALICKTKDECIKIKRLLDKRKRFSVKLLDEKEEQYDAGVLIVPSYLAKGLEFDAVIIINIHESYTTDPLDVKLLYVAMTRALHQMDLFFIAGKMPILNT